MIICAIVELSLPGPTVNDPDVIIAPGACTSLTDYQQSYLNSNCEIGVDYSTEIPEGALAPECCLQPAIVGPADASQANPEGPVPVKDPVTGNIINIVYPDGTIENVDQGDDTTFGDATSESITNAAAGPFDDASADKVDGNDHIECFSDGFATYECVGGAWVLQFSKRTGGDNTTYESNGGDIDFNAPPATPPTPPAGAQDGDQHILSGDNGDVIYELQGGTWVIVDTNEAGPHTNFTHHTSTTNIDVDNTAVGDTGTPEGAPTTPNAGDDHCVYAPNGKVTRQFDGTNWIIENIDLSCCPDPTEAITFDVDGNPDASALNGKNPGTFAKGTSNASGCAKSYTAIVDGDGNICGPIQHGADNNNDGMKSLNANTVGDYQTFELLGEKDESDGGGPLDTDLEFIAQKVYHEETVAGCTRTSRTRVENWRNNTLFVDVRHGDNATALPYREDKPYRDIFSAIADMVDGDTIYLRNGIHTVNQGFTPLPAHNNIYIMLETGATLSSPQLNPQAGTNLHINGLGTVETRAGIGYRTLATAFDGSTIYVNVDKVRVDGFEITQAQDTGRVFFKFNHAISTDKNIWSSVRGGSHRIEGNYAESTSFAGANSCTTGAIGAASGGGYMEANIGETLSRQYANWITCDTFPNGNPSIMRLTGGHHRSLSGGFGALRDNNTGPYASKSYLHSGVTLVDVAGGVSITNNNASANDVYIYEEIVGTGGIPAGHNLLFGIMNPGYIE